MFVKSIWKLWVGNPSAAAAGCPATPAAALRSGAALGAGRYPVCVPGCRSRRDRWSSAVLPALIRCWGMEKVQEHE